VSSELAILTRFVPAPGGTPSSAVAERVEHEQAVWLLAPDIVTAQALLLRLPSGSARIVACEGDRRVEVIIGGPDTGAEAVVEAVQEIIRWVDAERIPTVTATVWGVEQTFVCSRGTG
jgi:hypothetical protein